jgi:hypothetical protein
VLILFTVHPGHREQVIEVSADDDLLAFKAVFDEVIEEAHQSENIAGLDFDQIATN